MLLGGPFLLRSVTDVRRILALGTLWSISNTKDVTMKVWDILRYQICIMICLHCIPHSLISVDYRILLIYSISTTISLAKWYNNIVTTWCAYINVYLCKYIHISWYPNLFLSQGLAPNKGENEDQKTLSPVCLALWSIPPIPIWINGHSYGCLIVMTIFNCYLGGYLFSEPFGDDLVYWPSFQ